MPKNVISKVMKSEGHLKVTEIHQNDPIYNLT